MARPNGIRDVTPEQFAAIEDLLPEPARRRCRHVSIENRPPLESVRALKAIYCSYRSVGMTELFRISSILRKPVPPGYSCYCLRMIKQEGV